MTTVAPDNGTTQEKTVGQSQSRVILNRFVRNKTAMVSLVLLLLTFLFSVSAIGLGPIPGWWKFDYVTPGTPFEGGRPTLSLIPGEGFGLGEHPFGQNRIGVDYFAMTMRGVQTSLAVILVLGVVATSIGVVVGAVSGYYGKWVDSVLMQRPLGPGSSLSPDETGTA